MKFLWKISRLVTVLISIVGIYGFGHALFQVGKNLLNHSETLIVFLAGGIIFSVLWFTYFSKKGNFWSTLEHELTHALFALFFLKQVHSISASRKKGGLIRIEGGNALIALSPYFFPLACIPVLLLKVFLPIRFQIYMNFLLGFTYFFHLVNLFKEVHFEQSDIKSTGYMFSITLILFLNIFFLGIILSVLLNNENAIIQFIQSGLMESAHFLGNLGLRLG